MTEKISEQAARSVHAHAGIGAHCVIVQATTGVFRALHIDQPVLIHVRQGFKGVGRPSADYLAAPGQLIALPQGIACTVTNRVSVDERPLYRADAYVFDPALVVDYASQTTHGLSEPFQFTPDHLFLEALERARVALNGDEVPALRKHLMGEIILRLEAIGVGMRPRPSRSLGEDLRALVLANPAADWSGKRVADALAVSEPTLRRKLAATGTNLTGIIADVRMTVAANLLQATELPINRVALEVGYESASKFAARFRDRFGISPRDIRIHRDENDRTGMEIDQSRTAAE